MRIARTLVAVLVVPSLFGEKLPIQPYTTADGLPNNHVSRIRRDSRGFLWFCTDEGLSRFDGHSFTNYTVHEGLPHPWVNDFLETRDGGYWVATDAGVSRYDPTGKQRFRVYRPSERPGAVRVNSLLEDRDGVIWCGTYDGLYRMSRIGKDEVRFAREEIGSPDFYEAPLINSVFLDSRNVLWAASRSGLYRRAKGGPWERYSTPRTIPEDFFEMLAEDRDGRLWAATRRKGICSLIPDPKRTGQVLSRCYSTADGLPANDVRSVYQSSDRRLWIGTAGGLSELQSSERSARFRNYADSNGLSGSAIYALQEDRDGNLWMGTKENGAMKMALGGLATYGESEGYRTGDFSSSIFESERGELCVTTGRHSEVYVNAFDGSRFFATRLNAPQAVDPFRESEMLQTRGGAWWLTTAEGLFRFPPVRRAAELARSRPGAAFTVRQGLLDNALEPLYQDLNGDLWFAAWRAQTGAHALYRWENTANAVRNISTTNVPSLNHKTINAFAEDRAGRLWIGFREGGLVRGQSARFEELPHHPTEPVRGLYFDSADRLWISSLENGVIRVDDPASDQPRFRSYSTAEGLSSNHVLCMTQDRFGRMYLGTGSGVDRLDPATGSIRHYTTSEGLAKGAVRAAYRDRSGALWFATNSGISRLIPAPDVNLSPPVILISAVRVMGAPIAISDLGETRITGLSLAPDRNGLEIEFHGLDFSPNTRHRYEYKFEGSDTEWSPPTAQQSVNFARLASGAYRFLVRAVNADGVSSPHPATLEFTVTKPFWAQWWFLTATVLTAGILAYGAYRFRVAQVVELERVRARISADLHDDIGASLSQIAVLSEVARARLVEAHPASAGSLAEINAISREVMASMSDMVWVVNPRYDHLSDLIARVRRFAGDTLGPRDIALQFHGPDSGEDPLVGAEIRRHFLLIAKEAVHNIAKHSGATEARMEFDRQGDRLTLHVSDNGMGIDGAASEQGNGLVNIRRRATWLGGHADLRVTPGTGVAITVTAPLRGMKSKREAAS